MIVDCSLKQNAFICATLLQKVIERKTKYRHSAMTQRENEYACSASRAI